MVAENVEYISGDEAVLNGTRLSPGGFEFGVQGWNPGPQRPASITFFLNGTALVADRLGKPIRGAVIDGREYWFAAQPPQADDPDPGFVTKRVGERTTRTKLATHAEVIVALYDDRVDWRKLTCSGWPQLPYEELKKLPVKCLPPIAETKEQHDLYILQLQKIVDKDLRRAAMRFCNERFQDKVRELVAERAEDEAAIAEAAAVDTEKK